MELKVIIVEHLNIARIKGRKIAEFDEKPSHRIHLH